MDSESLKNNNKVIGQKTPLQLAEEIYTLLNQGSLYNIHQILQCLESDEDHDCLVKAFIQKFEFNFTKYIWIENSYRNTLSISIWSQS